MRAVPDSLRYLWHHQCDLSILHIRVLPLGEQLLSLHQQLLALFKLYLLFGMPTGALPHSSRHMSILQ
jgi:hypothetical protein